MGGGPSPAFLPSCQRPNNLASVIQRQADCERPRSSPPNLCASSLGSGFRPSGVGRGQITSHTALHTGHGNSEVPSGTPCKLNCPPLHCASGFISEYPYNLSVNLLHFFDAKRGLCDALPRPKFLVAPCVIPESLFGALFESV